MYVKKRGRKNISTSRHLFTVSYNLQSTNKLLTSDLKWRHSSVHYTLYTSARYEVCNVFEVNLMNALRIYDWLVFGFGSSSRIDQVHMDFLLEKKKKKIT